MTMMTTTIDDKIALIDLDGTVADYDQSMTELQQMIQGPNESTYERRYAGLIEPPHMEARRKLIQRQPGFWRSLRPIEKGFEVVQELRSVGFALHVLTKGPISTANAWSEKLEWCRDHLPDATVTVTGDKSLVYGRVLFDDFPPYFSKWLAVRPRGLVICLAHPWNEEFSKGGTLEHPNVIRYDASNMEELRQRIHSAYARKSGQ